ncbi:saccharopine dehydrogenase (plasmid) [Deinococcus aetherius]|uniref:Saccharopine dehydrogenase n=1 Tax=Deinococcus aetherius TaxID=200252 RepID=A0ABM8AKX9_9DEIO|nr:saccharopine dehydrogenase NADP-binding domain-containing protein [Deinococcus aetherius]BDP44480.1 saccharopine dehydrogenase [Deinococcus aetherius]
MTPHPRWMIYGANGFTGGLIAREARRRGLAPVLAGRSREATQSLAGELGLEGRVFGLDTPAEVARNLGGVALVLHCAGPFSRTHGPMLSACLATGTHYLDITGEHAVLEGLHWRGPGAGRAGIVAVSGVGFDVVPTDGVAAHLAAALPSATRLRLAFRGGTVSRGTAITMAEGAGEGGLSRQGGLLVREPVAARTWRVEHDGVTYKAVSIPWGDVVTAYYSTGIPTVETYLAVSPAAALVMRGSRLTAPLLRLPAARRFLRERAGRAKGPSETEMREGGTVVWGEVTDPAGRRRTAKLVGPEGYRFTVEAALASVERVLAGGVPAGAWTPSQAFGRDFVKGLPGVELRDREGAAAPRR